MPKGNPGNGDDAEIPSTILRSGDHAQDIWRSAHDSAVKTYGEGGRAHRVAYAALKHQYKKQGDRWVRKDEGAVGSTGGTWSDDAQEVDRRAPRADGRRQGGYGQGRVEDGEMAHALARREATQYGSERTGATG